MEPEEFNHIAGSYEAWYETPEGQRTDALEKAVLSWLLQNFPTFDRVLEIGCGTGHFTRWLREQEVAVVGLDLSTTMLAEAQTLNSPPLLCGDAQRLPFADSTFDVVTFITSLEFIAQSKTALLEALRVSRYGLVLGVLNRWSLLGLQRRLKGLFSSTIYDAAHFYGVAELKLLLQSTVNDEARIIWRTTLLPKWWPRSISTLPWGGFIGMALLTGQGAEV